jgi:hypothetical protein
VLRKPVLRLSSVNLVCYRDSIFIGTLPIQLPILFKPKHLSNPNQLTPAASQSTTCLKNYHADDFLCATPLSLARLPMNFLAPAIFIKGKQQLE